MNVDLETQQKIKDNARSEPQRILYVECGITAQSVVNTGIQRVVKNIVLNMTESCVKYGYALQFVAFREGTFYKIDGALLQHAAIPKANALSFARFFLAKALKRVHANLLAFHKTKIYQAANRAVKRFLLHERPENNWVPCNLLPINACGKESLLILLDSNWDNAIWPKLDVFRADGGKAYAVCYDLIPFTHPETVADQTRVAHTAWWSLAPTKLDSVICISKSVKKDFVDWQRKSFKMPPLPENCIGHFYLGAEFSESDPVIKVLTDKQSFCLMVGSLEPRKNQAFVLDAFEQLWMSGSDLRLVIVGAHGWKNEELLQRIQSHSCFNTKLFLIRDASDRDLVALYQATQALVIASQAEGFGLPIIEAHRYGAKILSCDIPVFREVVEAAQIADASFFEANNVDSLCQILRSASVAARCVPNEREISSSWMSWKDSANQMLKELQRLVAENETVQKKC